MICDAVCEIYFCLMSKATDHSVRLSSVPPAPKHITLAPVSLSSPLPGPSLSSHLNNAALLFHTAWRAALNQHCPLHCLWWREGGHCV